MKGKTFPLVLLILFIEASLVVGYFLVDIFIKQEMITHFFTVFILSNIEYLTIFGAFISYRAFKRGGFNELGKYEIIIYPLLGFFFAFIFSLITGFMSSLSVSISHFSELEFKKNILTLPRFAAVAAGLGGFFYGYIVSGLWFGLGVGITAEYYNGAKKEKPKKEIPE